MKKIANFLIERRRIVLIVMLVITLVCGVLATTVPINKDRTEYLADGSNMKQGLAIMESDFPETEEATIRVMFDDLTKEQIADVRDRLEAIPNVSSVTYEADSEEYNKGNHTLFVVTTNFDYSSDEEKAVEKAIETSFSEYEMIYQNNDIPSTELPFLLILFALILAIIILILMSHSWLDPVLFLATIGLAVVINAGTNAILPYTDEMTATVGPILQLVLSMDYSIILMNRYRQEKNKHGDKLDAMKAALAGSISSIASSSLTTVVGLLALVFLSFKLGPELGIVLAKGVFISMLCVFTVLPVMILGMDNSLEKTRKKATHIPTGWLTKISYAIRYVMPVVFVVFLIGSFILQSFTEIIFTENSEDWLADIFPKDNTVVVLYNNEDEKNIDGIVSKLEKDERVSSVLGYTNTLGKKMDAEEMSEAMNELGGDMRVNEDVIRMLYFTAADSALPTLTAAEFLNFITDSVIPNETLNEYIDDSIRENVEYFDKFSDKEKLTTPMTAAEMADFFGIEKKNVEQLFLYYTIQNGVADSGEMTLATFADFVLNTVAKDELYGTMFDAETLSSLKQLQTYTNKDTVLTQRTAKELSAMLGIDEYTVNTVFVLHNAGDVSDKTMTVSEFSAFLSERMMKDVMFGSYFDEDTKAQVETLYELIQLAASKQALTAEQMAQTLGMKPEEVSGLYYLYFSNDPAFQQETASMKMPLSEFFTLLKANAPAEQLAQLTQLEPLIELAVSENKLDAAAMSEVLGIGEQETTGLYYLYFSNDSAFQQEVASMKMPLTEFLALMKANVSGEQLAQLTQMEQLIGLAVSGQQMNAAAMANVLGIGEQNTAGLYYLYFSSDPAFQQEAATMTMPLTEFLSLLKANASESQLAQLTQMEQLINLAVSGQKLDAAAMAGITGMDVSQVAGLYMMNSVQAMTLPDFLAAALQLAPDHAQLQQINGVVQLAVSGMPLDAGTLASVFQMEPAQVYQLFGMTLSAQRTVTFADFTNFLVNSVLSNGAYAGSFTAEQAARLQQMHTIVQLAVSGTSLDAATLASVFGIETTQVYQLFGVTLSAQKTVAFSEFTNFLVNSVLSNEAYAASFTAEQAAQLRQMNSIVQLSISGEAVDGAALAFAFGLDKTQVYQLFGVTLSAQKSVPLASFTDFLVNSVLPNEAYAGSFSAEQAAQLQQMNSIVQLAASGTSLDADTLAQTFGMDTDMITTVFRLYFGADISDKTMSLNTFVNFILSDTLMSGMMDSASLSQLRFMQSIIHAAVNETAFTSAELASFMGMERGQAEQLYILYLYENGASWKLSPQKFVSFAAEEVLGNEEFKEFIDEKSAEDLKLGHTLIEAVVSDTPYTVDEMTGLLTSLTDEVNENDVEVMYLYYGGVTDTDTDMKMTIPELFAYLSEEMIDDERFAEYFDEETRADILNSEVDLYDAIDQLKGDTYSRLVITSDYPDESPETHAHIAKLKVLCEENLNEFYLVGNSVMVSEMDETFDREYLMITLITAVAIFLVVLFAFRNPTIPLILTLIVQCGVFFTVAIIGAYSGAMYYLALLIVQSILMGATIDYGIVFCNFYKDARKTMDVRDALQAAYEGSMHTIMTSGSILVLVLAALGIFASSAMISEVCVTLSTGVFIAVLLILFVLPGMVACCDKLICRKKNK